MEYRRQLGTLDAAMIVIGTVIGGGIFMNPPGVAKAAGSVELALGLWALGGVLSIAGAFCFAELGARLPDAGGSYIYIREGFGRLPAFIQGWALLLVSGAGSVAAISVFFGMIAQGFLGLPESARPVLAIAAIAALTAVNCIGLKPTAWVQNCLSILKIALLFAVIGVGLTLPPPAAEAAPGVGSWQAVAGSLVFVMFAYNGYQVVGFVAGEIDDAQRRIPQALVGGIFTLTALYLAVNYAYLRALGVNGLAKAFAPANILMDKALGKTGGTLMTIGTLISALGFLNSGILTVPRAFQAMSADRLFFRTFGDLHERWGTPAKAIVLQSVWAVLLIFSGQLDQLLAYVTFADGLFMGLSAASIFGLRARETEKEAAQVPYRMPLYPWLPALYVLASVGIMASSIAASPRNALIGAGLICAGIPAFFFWSGNKKAE